MNNLAMRIQQWLDGKDIKLTTTEAFGAVAALVAIILIRGCA